MRLWVDDKRSMPKGFDVWAETGEEAIIFLQTGQVTHISLDHDMGLEGLTGYGVACWIENEAYEKRLPHLTWSIHSDNFPGSKLMYLALKKADHYWNAIS